MFSVLREEALWEMKEEGWLGWGWQREKWFSNGRQHSSACAARRDAAPRGEKVRSSNFLSSVSSRAFLLIDVGSVLHSYTFPHSCSFKAWNILLFPPFLSNFVFLLMSSFFLSYNIHIRTYYFCSLLSCPFPMC